MNVIDVISTNRDSLSNKQKIIADYLTLNSYKIGFMSLKDLSLKIDVSEVTILNFSKGIGYESFSELKKAFQELIKSRLCVPKDIKSSLMELDNLDDVYNNTIQIHKLNYEAALLANDVKIFKDISKWINSCKRVYICGQGVSKVIGDYINNRFKLINIDSKNIDIGDIMESSVDFAGVTKDECFILISFPQYSQNVVNLSKYLSNNNFEYLAITDSKDSPLIANAKYSLKSYSSSVIFKNFISSTISLIEILLSIISFEMKEELMVHLDKLENVQSELSQHSKSY